VPNIFRPYHEKILCIVARKARGEYVDPKALRLQKKREAERMKKEEEDAKQAKQKRLKDFFS